MVAADTPVLSKDSGFYFIMVVYENSFYYFEVYFREMKKYLKDVKQNFMHFHTGYTCLNATVVTMLHKHIIGYHT